ncbi:uncharacterized protein Dana_GF18569 [Drosophila ananassae]|uniref:Uncharacterized protein n=1 Tax=Drosophila ananassae TaxID=7217 RepID=B3M3C9_DROAN|nr:uncharacterized protein LOC6501341 [Drosophila ananassae]EDV43590.1 uncharacterized protein Dana_GF18569 [Drosophila ananassae]
MENAFIKRRSVTLSTRLLQKRHSASPQSCGRPGPGQDVTLSAEAPGSPSSIVTISDDGESTPPHKRAPSLDDSVDFSPRLDVSLSPNYLFSQTLATESPEVGWRWNRSSTTDSGFDSAEITAVSQNTRDRRRQIAFKGCEDRRSQLDNEQWRAQQMRAREMLKERCDKLHRQLDQVAVSEKPIPGTKVVPPVAARTRSASKKTEPKPLAPPPVAADPMADFLNDSETDMFLLEASQQLESKIDTQNACESKPKVSAITTPTSHHKTKRPSFYMKFLEDESESEDWLSALEEAVEQATMPKKPRTSLQRYKSMPTTGDTSSGISTITSVTSGRGCSTNTSASNASGTALVNTPRIKRHASSHTLSPATSHARGKLFGSRK